MLSDAQIAVYQAPENLLADRVIMITGAGDGIGKVAALHCAQHGATVILAGRTVAKLEQVYDTIVAKGGPEPVIYPIDLEGASSEDYDALCGHIEEQFGRLDGLLHNAGILGQRTPLSNYRTDVWDKVMQVNVTAGFQMTQALMPVLEKSDNASVIFTSSGVGRVGRDQQLAVRLHRHAAAIRELAHQAQQVAPRHRARVAHFVHAAAPPRAAERRGRIRAARRAFRPARRPARRPAP